jgi:hypothetical protein
VYDRDRAFAGTCGSGVSSWVELTEDDLPTRPQDSTFPALTLPQLMLTERVAAVAASADTGGVRTELPMLKAHPNIRL